MNIRSNHQLIPRDQSYVLDRKLVTIHSNDRDLKKFPNSNNFEVTLPETITSVDSMRLAEIQLPTKYYNFSDELQNTKIRFKLGPVNAHLSNGMQTLLQNAEPFTLTIPAGFYNPSQLANKLSYLMNKIITDYLTANGESHVYHHFKVFNDEPAMTFWIGNNCDGFTLYFDEKIDYDVELCDQTSAWDRYSEWGMGYFMGFEKERYAYSTSTTALVNSSVSPNVEWLNFTDSHNSPTLYYIKAPSIYKLMGDRTIYMEVEKYNHIDELVPHSQSTNSLYNNDFNGTVNSAFAKIPISISPYSNNTNIVCCNNSSVSALSSNNIVSSTHFDPPLERIQKLKFRFRNHNGVLINFLNQPFNFTVEFNCLRNEISRQYSIRIPAVYSFK